MTICVAGKNNIAVDGLNYVLENYAEHDVVVCLTKNDDGVNSWQKSLKYTSDKKNVKIVSLENLYEIKDLILLSLEFDRIIKPEKFASEKLFNIHFSKLPAYKGMFTSVMPILNGEEESGVTLHKIVSGIDTGEIIDQISFPLSTETTARDLYDLYLKNSLQLFKNNIDSLIKGNFNSKPQNAVGSSYYSKSALDFSNITIDTNKTAFEIHNQIRAFTFRDYQLPSFQDHFLYKSELTNNVSDQKAGTIKEIDDWKIVINTIDYDIIFYIDHQDKLFSAAENGDISKYEELKKNNYPVFTRTKLGWDLLIVACYHNQYEFVEYLIKDNWNVNTSNYKGTTALMYAMTTASRGNGMEAFKLLLPIADYHVEDDAGKDLLTYAKQYGNEEVISYLLKNI